MKKLITLTLLILSAALTHAATIEVYYFHYSRRCATCQAVETETLKAIQQLYPEQFKKGQVVFKSVNLDEKSSQNAAKKCNADGQSLLILQGTKRVDLTEQAFMYAKSKPEKLKAAIKKTVGGMLGN